MKEVLYYLKCNYCNEEYVHIMRDDKINKNMSDGAILKLVNSYAKNPFTVQFCEECNMLTLQTRVAWQGLSPLEVGD